jgi:hypothetical protein
MTQKKPPRNARRFLSFRLRSLMLITLISGCGLGWLTREMKRAAKQREAVQALTKVGGSVVYDYLPSGSKAAPAAATSAVPPWIKDALGSDVFCHAEGLSFTPEPWNSVYQRKKNKRDYVTNEDLAHLRHLTRLQRLRASNTRITDGGLVHLPPLISLQRLNLSHCMITDQGLWHLRGMQHLEELDISYTHVTAQGVRDLRKALPNCAIWCAPLIVD